MFLGNDDDGPAGPGAVAAALAAVPASSSAPGLIKMRGDRCWRDLTCLYYHHETQPMPDPLSWYFHHLPRPLHRVEVAANHVTQLVVPFAAVRPAAGRERRGRGS